MEYKNMQPPRAVPKIERRRQLKQTQRTLSLKLFGTSCTSTIKMNGPLIFIDQFVNKKRDNINVHESLVTPRRFELLNLIKRASQASRFCKNQSNRCNSVELCHTQLLPSLCCQQCGNNPPPLRKGGDAEAMFIYFAGSCLDQQFRHLKVAACLSTVETLH